jgi:hypothetical protein
VSDLSSLDPEARRLIERLQREHRAARESGAEPPGVIHEPLSSAARAVLADWVTSGDYDRAVAAFTARDPDISTQ